MRRQGDIAQHAGFYTTEIKCQPPPAALTSCPCPRACRAAVSQTLAYTITVSGKQMCGAVYTPPLSWGSLFLIYYSVAAVVYPLVGVAFNVKVRKRKLTVEDAFPQWAYWRELPGLLKDGAAFSWEVTLPRRL